MQKCNVKFAPIMVDTCNKLHKDGWRCTRERKHNGLHHAHISETLCCKTWGFEEIRHYPQKNKKRTEARNK